MKNKNLFVITLLVIIFTLPSLTYGWGNGNPNSNRYPNYGMHDLIAEQAYLKLKGFDETKARWITEFYTNDYTQLDYGPNAENFLGWTDDPDSVIKDWDNHNCEINTGFHRSIPVCGAPSRVKQLYDSIVNNLIIWIKAGMPSNSSEAKEAARAAAYITHYYGDLSQTMHTDETKTGNPEHQHPSYDPAGRTYHGYYESISITDQFLDQMKLDLDAYNFPVNVKVTDVPGAVRVYAEYSNSHDNKTIVVKKSIVGTFYWYVVDTFKKLYDAAISYLGARGYDQKLYLETRENVKLVIENITQLFYTAYEEAELKAGQPELIIDTVEACVVINEFLSNPDLPPKKGGVEWVELYNKCKSTLDISGYKVDDEEGGSAPKTIPYATTLLGNGFWSFTLYNGDGYLNNTGDTIRFLKPDGIIIDQRSFINAPPDSSQFRLPDGGTWQDLWDYTPTRDAPNG